MRTRRSALRRRSLLTAGIRRVDRAAVTAAVERWARVVAACPEVRRGIWYGSFVTGIPTPRSDVDLCVVVSDSAGAGAAPRHTRGAAYLPAFATPAPFDIAVLTASEYATLAMWAPAWAQALADGRVLLER